MCGIVGGLTPNIALGIDALYHRGPDARGAITVGKVSLGHTRLSILGPDAIEWFRFGEFAGWLIEGERG